MEKGIEEYIKEKLELREIDVRNYSPLSLAYIGDSVYELFIRTLLLNEGNDRVNHYHKRASELVKAHTQANLMRKLKPALTDEEEAVYKRGRNAKSVTIAKNASMSDYRKATGFEAMIGYLYLEGNLKRIADLLKIGLEIGEKKE